MATHLGQCRGFQADPILAIRANSPVSCPSGFGLAMCTGGHATGLRGGLLKFTTRGRVCCSIRSDREPATEEKEVNSTGLSFSSDDAVKKWMVAALAAVVMSGVAGEPAMAFGWFGQPQIEKDPVQPFTLYGSILKKYLIEDIVENKVVGRKKGFTASACVNALDASKETPELQGVPPGLKVTIIGEPSCSKGQGQTREESCTAPCRKACQGAVSQHLTEVKDETGYVLDQSDIKKVTETCSVQCFNECTKPGKSISFVFPFRPH